MTKWESVEREANALSAKAEDLYLEVEDLRCPFKVKEFDGGAYVSPQRCRRDRQHPGVHHISNYGD